MLDKCFWPKPLAGVYIRFLWTWCPVKLPALDHSSEVLTLELSGFVALEAIPNTGLSPIDPAKMLRLSPLTSRRVQAVLQNNYAQGTESKERWKILKHAQMCSTLPICLLETFQYLPEKEVSGAKCWLQSPSLLGTVSHEI